MGHMRISVFSQHSLFCLLDSKKIIKITKKAGIAKKIKIFYNLKWNRTLFGFEINYITIKSSPSNVIDPNFKWGHRVILGEIASRS
jgi:hypothetical protein